MDDFNASILSGLGDSAVRPGGEDHFVAAPSHPFHFVRYPNFLAAPAIGPFSVQDAHGPH